MGHIAGDNGPKRLVDEYIEKVRTQTIYREAVKDLSDLNCKQFPGPCWPRQEGSAVQNSDGRGVCWVLSTEYVLLKGGWPDYSIFWPTCFLIVFATHAIFQGSRPAHGCSQEHQCRRGGKPLYILSIFHHHNMIRSYSANYFGLLSIR